MCAYCVIGDNFFRFDPPFNPDEWMPDRFKPYRHHIPAPVRPHESHPTWPLDKLIAYRDILKEIKELEDKIGCPCEPNKMPYIDLLEARITELKKMIPPPGSPETMG